jgi:hypothetical protein
MPHPLPDPPPPLPHRPPPLPPPQPRQPPASPARPHLLRREVAPWTFLRAAAPPGNGSSPTRRRLRLAKVNQRPSPTWWSRRPQIRWPVAWICRTAASICPPDARSARRTRRLSGAMLPVRPRQCLLGAGPLTARSRRRHKPTAMVSCREVIISPPMCLLRGALTPAGIRAYGGCGGRVDHLPTTPLLLR